ncbi:hypothetical protein HPL003_20655 [Paenibacillus terrae HPL-003]|uniref:Uncharacterized protein n=1 Tax=Paenibacillus terrae (strain HPL-003) TaxID=985665 RepID=G7VU49_PAETH|nr:hypothetical protein [Paenibacillus terrae]AET60865.1 hypothetical protein HPL003_20655 [Paenibacillus terrae HPL-003]
MIMLPDMDGGGCNPFEDLMSDIKGKSQLDNGAPLDFNQGMLGYEKASTTQLRGERRRELYRRFF